MTNDDESSYRKVRFVRAFGVATTGRDQQASNNFR